MAKLIQARQAQKIDTYENWLKAINFKPMAGEILIVSDYESLIVVGDGEHFADYLVTEAVKNIKTGVQEAIAAHNVNSEAHADIREAIANVKIDNVTNGSGEDSLVFLSDNADNASGKHSITVGSDDKSAISGIIGDTLTNKVTINNPSAEGEASIAVNGSARAISASDIAIGPLTTAGVKGYYWSNIAFNTDGTAVITLSTKQDRASAPSSTDWAIDDIISIVNDTQYPACAKITAVNGANITVDKLPFSSVVSVSSKKPDDNSIFACYKKEVAKVTIPIIGTVVAENYCWYPRNGEVELGWVATALGIENLATGSGSVVAGFNNWQAGNFGATFGRDNIGGYGNVIGGGWNESTGVHSAIFGRDHENHGDYNFQSGRITKIESGEKNTISGEYSVIRNGKYNDVSGYNNLVENSNFDLVGGSTNKVKAGAGHIVGGKENQVNSGYYDVVGGSEHNVNGDQNAAFGKKHSLTEKSDYNLVGGFTNTIEKSQSNLVGGSGNTVKNSKNIVGGSDNIVATNNNIVGGSSNNVKAGHTNIIGGNNNTIENSTFSAVAGNNHSIQGDQVNVSGKGHKLESGAHYNMVGGETHTLSNSTRNVVEGYNNKLTASNKNIVGGESNTLDGTEYSVIGGANSTIKGKYVLNTGKNNTINNHNYTATIGTELETSSANQVVIGQYNDSTTTTGDAFVVGFGNADTKKNVFTVPKDGIAKKDSDAVTLGVLEGKGYITTDEVGMEFVKEYTEGEDSGKELFGGTSIAYGDGKYVAVNGKEVAYSYDGLTWTKTTLPNREDSEGWDENNLDVAYGNGMFVLICEYYKTYRSFDGITWELPDNCGPDEPWEGIEYLNDRFVAFGKPNNVANVKWSTDGWNWEYSAIFDWKTIYSMAYNNGVYVATTDTEVYYSTNLTEWVPCYIDGFFSNYLHKVISTENGFRLFATDWEYTFTSEDGINWSSGGTVFIDGAISAISKNGQTYFITNYGEHNSISKIDSTGIETILYTNEASGSLCDITYGNDRFVVVASDGYSLTSVDGITWHIATEADITTKVTIPTHFEQKGEDITTDVTKFVLTNGTKNTVQTGRDNIVGGENNTLVNSTFSIVGGNKHNIKGDQNLVVGSENKLDGSSKSNFNIVGGQNNTIQASYTLSAGQNNKITHSYSSTIGSNLETTAWDQLVVGKYNDLTNTGRDAFVVAAGASGARKNVLTVPKSGVPSIDTDAITLGTLNERLAEFNPEVNPEDIKVKAMSFTPPTANYTWGAQKIAYGDGTFVGIVGDEYGTSTDGLHWRVTKLDPMFANTTWISIVYDNIQNRFIALHSSEKIVEIKLPSRTYNIISSGINSDVSRITWCDLIFDGQRFIAIGNKPYDRVAAYYGLDEFYLAYTSNPEGDWSITMLGSAQGNSANEPWLVSSIAYNKGRYVVFCSSVIADSSNEQGALAYSQLYESTDLQSWNLHKWYNEGLIHSPEHVIPTPNGFFGCDEDWYDAWYSTDGINWQFLGLTDTLGCVAAACNPEGIIISLTKDGKAIVYDENNLPDADTITYAQRIDRSMPDYGWSDIVYANGMFVATRRNYSFVSSDGINWTRLDTNYYFHQENVDITSDVINALATDFMKKEDTINPSQIAGDGTINSKLHIKGAGIPLTIQSTDADTVFVQFCNSDREIIGHLGVGASGPYYRQGINTDYYSILHSGNIAENATIKALEARIAELEAKLAALEAATVSVLSGPDAPANDIGEDGDIYLVTE